MPLDAAARLFSSLNPELWIVTAADGPRRGGLVATSVNRASIVPAMPRATVMLARHHFTWELVEASGAFAAHLVSEEQIDRVWRFGLRSGRDGDKFAGLEFHTGATGSPLLADVPGFLECRVEAALDTGDRTLYLAEVVDCRVTDDVRPLTMHRMLALAPDDRLQEFKTQLVADAALDAGLIGAWRGRGAQARSRQD